MVQGFVACFIIHLHWDKSIYVEKLLVGEKDLKSLIKFFRICLLVWARGGDQREGRGCKWSEGLKMFKNDYNVPIEIYFFNVEHIHVKIIIKFIPPRNHPFPSPRTLDRHPMLSMRKKKASVGWSCLENGVHFQRLAGNLI